MEEKKQEIVLTDDIIFRIKNIHDVSKLNDSGKLLWLFLNLKQNKNLVLDFGSIFNDFDIQTSLDNLETYINNQEVIPNIIK